MCRWSISGAVSLIRQACFCGRYWYSNQIRGTYEYSIKFVTGWGDRLFLDAPTYMNNASAALDLCCSAVLVLQVQYLEKSHKFV